MKYRDIGERFEKYASIPTQSAEGCVTTPSTDCQRVLAALLADELKEMGASDVIYDEEHCYVYATIPGNIPADHEKTAARPDSVQKKRENLAPIIGLMAHMDTSDAVAKTEVSPRRIHNYDGTDIILSENPQILLSTERFPSLLSHVGHDLIVTDGTTVLGGDDKAGIAAIMETADFMLHHPEYAHGTVRICFTPDEEVGNGPLWIDQKIFACDYAYTIDGEALGDLEFENFNAATATIRFNGVSAHPGSSFGIMVNALLAAMEFNSMLPAIDIPAETREREGFFHLTELNGTSEKCSAVYIVRDHDRQRFEDRKHLLERAAGAVNRRYGEGTAVLSISDSYYNMEEKIRPHMHLISNVREAMEKLGITPHIDPIRGGTDGCVLSFRGIPCPNLGTGGYNCHSIYEYVSVNEMALNVKLLVRILNSYASYELD